MSHLNIVADELPELVALDTDMTGAWADDSSSDWLDAMSDALEWCVLPMPASLSLVFTFPPSPTSVDCASDHALATTCLPLTDGSVDRLSMTFGALTVETPPKVKKGRDVQAQAWVRVLSRQEERRQRQRAYERKYRRNRRTTRKSLFDEWIFKELKLFEHLRTRAAPWRVGGPVPTLEQLMMEEKMAIVDRLHLQSLKTWQRMLELRIYDGPETVTTHDAWQKLHRSLLGTTAIAPFRPFHYTFEWS